MRSIRSKCSLIVLTAAHFLCVSSIRKMYAYCELFFHMWGSCAFALSIAQVTFRLCVHRTLLVPSKRDICRLVAGAFQ